VGLLHLFNRRRERRAWPRHSAIKTAWIRLENEPVPIICVLWNVSYGGAMVALASLDSMPQVIRITLDRKDQFGTTCRVVWRNSGQIGIEFLANAEPIRSLIAHMQPA
jgi:hypothetical protein